MFGMSEGHLCVSDMPIGANARFTLMDGRVFTGRIIHNYGRGIVLATVDGRMVEFDGCNTSLVETMDEESSAGWRQNISKSQAEFKQLLEKI